METAAGPLRSTPLALIDLRAADGIVGRAYLRAYSAAALPALVRIVDSAAALLVGHPADPSEARARLTREFFLVGTSGLVGMAMAGLDMALWDGLARRRGLTLTRALGGERRPLPAYATLHSMAPAAAAREAGAWAERGVRAVKVKLGGHGPNRDLGVLRALADAVGPELAVMADYNQSLSREEAERRLAALDLSRLTWIEEPLWAGDDTGHASLRKRIRTPVQLGENWWSVAEMRRSLQAGACDEVMLDVARIGGVSGWVAAAETAAEFGRRVSSHAFLEFSAQLLAATASRGWIEYLDVASPILREPVALDGGYVSPPAAPGAGLDWNEATVRRWRVC